MATQKRDGGADFKFFESAEIASQLDNVKSWLQRNCKKVSGVSDILFTVNQLENGQL